MKLGIVGLPNVGKSTLFNAITKAGAESANYPFCTIEPNVGVVSVPDERLDKLAEMYNPEKYTPAVIEFVDIAGLVKGASKGEGLGNKFLSNIREVDAICHVVRCFDDPDVVHVDGSADPARDIGVIELELILSDMEIMEKRIERTQKMMKGGDKSFAAELAVYEKVYAALEAEKPARLVELDEEERQFMKEVQLISMKPVLYCANIAEDDIKNPDIPYVNVVKDIAAKSGSEVVVISAKIEDELGQLDPEDREMFLEDLGIDSAGLDKMIKASYKLLGLISYLTAGPQEVRAWTIKEGTKAPQAAGKIHTDFERGFIRAEVVAYDDLVSCGSMTAAKEKGLVRSEGKEYVMKDGDVVLFRFNV
ncbi:MAG: redox-regulated ATPase YchF [Saccharofermentans sp.]|nr:redox-regulated ATPase YchF [Saccharofermentans sp.]